MKNKKKIKELQKNFARLEALIKPNSITIVDPNDENHKIVIGFKNDGSFESYHERIIIEVQKEVITQEN